MNPARWIAARFVRIWLSSLRWRGSLPVTESPVVYCVWHRDVPAAGALLRHVDVTSLISRSHDGDFLVEILRGASMRFARGSDSLFAVSGARRLLRELKAGRSVATTWDGPKGPAEVAKPGPTWLSKASGAKLVELRFSYGRHARLSDWSRMRIPMPGSIVTVEVS